MSQWQRWRLLRYRLPLTRPLTTTAASTHREGIIVALTDADGFTGHGEAAPLPGLHADSLDAVQAALIAALTAGAPAPPVAQFAIESAALMLSAARQQTRPARLLCDAPAERVAVNALITGPDPLTSARHAIEAGATALKLKVGRRELREEAALLASIRALSGDVALRLDANRAWTLPEATWFCERAVAAGIAYIEEPLADPALLSRLHAQTGVPLALDESLLERRPVPDGVAAVVIKPSVVTLSGALQWMSIAQQHSAAAVISGAFESGVARRVNLALAASAGGAVCGLSTAAWLAEDVLDPPLLPVDGVFALPAAGALRPERLTEVAAG